ncbi:MAG: hypothetical protein LUD47_06275 [Clostridia bacterium]|nr:hypothetical protein [Clostridia bacterium]
MGLDFQKMTPKGRQALAATETVSEEGVFFGNDANLNIQSKNVHICEIRKHTI